MNRLSIIVPAYNEEKLIGKTLDRVFSVLPDVYEVIVINDGSKDRTAQIVKEYLQRYPAIHLIDLDKNQGKTNALKVGFSQSTGEIVIVQDADMEYDPVDIPLLIEPIVNDNADVVYGSRFLVRKASRVLYYRHYIANKFLTMLSNLLTDLNFTDIETGYKAFRGELIRSLQITSHGFGVEVELTAKVAKKKVRVYEVPISYYGRTYEEGKKIGMKDGLYAIFCIFRYNLFG